MSRPHEKPAKRVRPEQPASTAGNSSILDPEAPRLDAAKLDPAPIVDPASHDYSIRELGEPGDPGASVHYADPAYYTATYRDRRHDVAYYVQKAKLSKGPVLEYGVGNGRVALHVARAGIEIEGVDLSQPMLDDFSRRLGSEPPKVRARVRLHHADMRSFRVERRFALVIAPFNAILHLYARADLEEFLSGVRQHLRDDGCFIFDFSRPEPLDLAKEPARAYEAPPLRHPTTGEVVRYAERFEYDPLRQLMLVRMDFAPVGGSPAFSLPLTHRQYFPREMEALLHYNGFEQIFFTADFTDQPADRNVDSIVVCCRARR